MILTWIKPMQVRAAIVFLCPQRVNKPWDKGGVGKITA